MKYIEVDATFKAKLAEAGECGALCDADGTPLVYFHRVVPPGHPLYIELDARASAEVRMRAPQTGGRSLEEIFTDLQKL